MQRRLGADAGVEYACVYMYGELRRRTSSRQEYFCLLVTLELIGAGKDGCCAFRTGFRGRDRSDPTYSASF